MLKVAAESVRTHLLRHLAACWLDRSPDVQLDDESGDPAIWTFSVLAAHNTRSMRLCLGGRFPSWLVDGPSPKQEGSSWLCRLRELNFRHWACARSLCRREMHEHRDGCWRCRSFFQTSRLEGTSPEKWIGPDVSRKAATGRRLVDLVRADGMRSVPRNPTHILTTASTEYHDVAQIGRRRREPRPWTDGLLASKTERQSENRPAVSEAPYMKA